jgi:hypothetical protein
LRCLSGSRARTTVDALAIGTIVATKGGKTIAPPTHTHSYAGTIRWFTVGIRWATRLTFVVGGLIPIGTLFTQRPRKITRAITGILFIPGTVFALALVLAVALSTPGATPWCNTTAFSVDTGTRRILGTRCIYMNQYSTINVFGARSRGRVGRDLHEQWGGPGLLGLAEMYMKQEKKSKCASKQRGHHLMERGGARSKKKREGGEEERRRGGKERISLLYLFLSFFFSFI